MPEETKEHLLSSQNAPRQQSSSYARSFSRALTFEGFGRMRTNFSRTMTTYVHDAEDTWVQDIMNDYIFKAPAKGMDLDVPLPGGFAKELRFWKVAGVSTGLGILMGLLGLCFLNITDHTPVWWTNNDSFSDPSSFDQYSGQPYWIAVTAGTGLLVGLLRWLTSFPENVDGIFKEINTYHVHYQTSPATFFISMLSLAGGAALGPEAALGNVGGGLAVYLKEHLRFDEDDSKLIVLAGMAAAIGALLPSPLLTVMLIFELGKPPRALMESVTVLGTAAVAAFVMNYWLLGKTFLEYLNPKLFLFSADWEFQVGHCFSGFVIGLVSAGLNFVFVVYMGVSKQVFGRLRARLEHNKFLLNVIPPLFGGLLIGATNYCLPMTVGNGSLVTSKIIQYGYQEELSIGLLVGSGFARGLLLTISMNAGFIGGFIYPLCTIGIIAAMVTYLKFSYLPVGLCLSCYASSILTGIVPAPYTFVCLSSFLFSLNVYQTAPVFIATMTSYVIVSGSGIFSALQARALEQDEKIKQSALLALAREKCEGDDEEHENILNEAQLAKERREEETLSLNKYLSLNNPAYE